MKLYFKRTGHDGDASYLCIADINGKCKYDLRRSDRLSKRILIRDQGSRKDVAEVKQVLKSLMPKYQIIIGGEVVLEVKKEFHPILPKYTLSGSLGWEIRPMPIKYLYEVGKDGRFVMRSNGTQDVHWWGRGVQHFEIEYAEETDELAAVALAVTINVAIEGEKFMRSREEIEERTKQ